MTAEEKESLYYFIISRLESEILDSFSNDFKQCHRTIECEECHGDIYFSFDISVVSENEWINDEYCVEGGYYRTIVKSIDVDDMSVELSDQPIEFESVERIENDLLRLVA